MMPITNFLSCTHVFDEFESLSPEQRHHAKTYATGLVAAATRPWRASHAKFFRPEANAPSTSSSPNDPTKSQYLTKLVD
ncbi:hypothetical protein GCM10008985_07830 [Halococcus dombrowskii]|uniref:Uncharacterized protein n=1 Tax=Halococcus dombrowskii TaxID=179637 RepID=A0AAV3SCS6_HALDO